MNNIPPPSLENLNKSNALLKIIKNKIHKKKSLKFSEYMNLVLYNKKYGYYCNDNIKIDYKGDFITAPNISNIFGKTISNQIKQIFLFTKKNIYEFGAGTGHLAVDILKSLSNTIENYYIIDVSKYFINKQCEYIKNKVPHLFHKVKFLNKIPSSMQGVIIANELLDAIACDLIHIDYNHQIYLLNIGLNDKSDKLEFIKDGNLSKPLLTEVNKYIPKNFQNYTTEMHLNQKHFIKSIIKNLTKGVAIFIDYGFPAKEYYHHQRNMGTLIGHYKHLVINNPFILPGLVDLTCHINFTAIADAIVENNANLLGYTTQANFLLNLNILDFLNNDDNINSHEYLKETNSCKILLNPSEMGELFKVIAFGKNIDVSLLGFKHKDLSYTL